MNVPEPVPDIRTLAVDCGGGGIKASVLDAQDTMHVLAEALRQGLTGIAVASLAQREGVAATPPHHPPKVKRVIHLFMAGAPSQLELFDNKPELAKLEGRPLPPSV